MSLQSEVSPHIRPGDDFYQYVNQKWIAEHPVPDNKASISAFSVLADQNYERIKTLLEADISADDTVETAVAKQFYQAAMDTTAIEKAGLRPVDAQLATIAKATTPDKVRQYMQQCHRDGQALIWITSFDVDDKDSKRYIARMYQSGLGLPDRDYYFDNDDRFTKIRADYNQFLISTFTLLGYDNPTQRAQNVISIEKKLAEASQTATQERDSQATYNMYSIAELQTEVPTIDWTAYFAHVGFKDLKQVVLSQPSFIATAAQLLDSEPVAAWQDYCVMHTVVPLMNALPEAYDALHFSFYGTVLGGATEREPRFRRIISKAIRMLPEPTGQLYVKHYFDEAAKQEISDLVGYIIDALRVRIDALDWMSNATKQRAHEKLDTFIPLLGYPDTWRSYADVKLGAVHADNILALDRFEWEYDRARLAHPVDRREWVMPPALVNAAYWPNANSIVFPAAILQAPFFTSGGDFAANYGGIGMVIGHEISHGFDDQGSIYDQDGNMQSWWTLEDRSAFEARSKQLIDQYSQYVLEGRHVNGELTVGENIGDLGGMLIAFDALQQKIKQSGNDKLLDGFTPAQRFFIAQARVWRDNARPEHRLRGLVSDPHSPDMLRVNGVVTNVDGFYEAFDVKEGDALYKPEKERVRIW